MNKQKYMAELAKLLGFMSGRDRQAALEKFDALFEAAESEQELIAELGSPTRLAVTLARDYVPSPVEPEPEAPPAAQEESDAAQEREDEEPEPAGDEAAREDGADEPVEREEAEPEAEPVFVGSETVDAGVLESIEAAVAAESEPEETETSEEKPRSKLRAGALVFYILLSLAVGLPIAVALIALGVPFIALGAGIIAGAVWAFMGLFSVLSMVSDVLLVIGAGLVLTALGILLVWLGIWISLELGRLWIGGVVLKLGAKLCVRKDKEVAAE